MNIQNLSACLLSIIKSKGVSTPDGRPLFAYDLNRDDYIELGQRLADAAIGAGGINSLAEASLGRPPLHAPPAAFVLYASEWWKREYAGGPWSWTPIVKALGGVPEAFSHQTRSEFVARGLAFWGLTTQDRGKTYIGPIVSNSGIPMRLLASASGPLSALLAQVLKQAARFGWSHDLIRSAVLERQIHLPAAYRTQGEIAELLATFVGATLQLIDEFRLQGLADPVARLDQVNPDWRRRFPVSLESEAAQTLLAGLVREAATQSNYSSRRVFLSERRLVLDPGLRTFSLSAYISHPKRVDALDLSLMFGLRDVDSLPRYFSIDLDARTRRPFAEGRLMLGSSESTAVLSVNPIVVGSQDATDEIQLILRTPTGDLGERCTIQGGSALPEDDPWIFVEDESGHKVLVSTGGARLPHDTAWIALASGWTIEGGCDCEPLGELHVEGGSARTIFSLRSDVRLRMSDIVFQIRLRIPNNSGQIYQWQGARLPEARGRAIFRDRQLPRLFRTTEDGLEAVPRSSQQWRYIGNPEIIMSREVRGPAEVRILDEGELVSRQRIFLLPPEARIEYISGQAVGIAQVRFLNWGDVDIAAETLPDVTAQVRKESSTVIVIDLSAKSVPPSEFRVFLHWSSRSSDLGLTLAYPVSGGRFLSSDGKVMQAAEKVTLRDLVGMRLQIFDTNPDRPKRYELQLTLGSGARQLSSRYPIKTDSGQAEVRLIDYRPQIESLLGLFDELDAKVKICLLVGGQPSSEIEVGRYTTAFNVEQNSIRVLDEALSLRPHAGLEGTQVWASPLTHPDMEHLELSPIRSEGAHSGAWAVDGMSPDLAPWLVYPGVSSSLLFRPLVWVKKVIQDAPTINSPDVNEVIEVSDLRIALSQSDPAQRWSDLHDALHSMSEDHLHESWSLMDDLWQTFHHLPLTALDVWRMLAKQPKAMLSFLLRSELEDSGLAEVVRRFRRETGWLPELTTVNDLCEVARSYWLYWFNQISDEARCKRIYDKELEHRFNLLIGEIPSLRPLVETVIFAATGTVSELLIEVAGPSKKPTKELLRQLWDGPDSLVNSQLFLVNQERNIWPRRDFVEKHALPAFFENISAEHGDNVKVYLNRIIWGFDAWRRYYATQFNPVNQPDFKFSVVNLPVLCAFWAATSTSRQWWSDPRSRLALKQIRDFDPIWFEQAYRQAFKVCMSIDGLVQLPNITKR